MTDSDAQPGRGRRASITQVARLAGVSYQTVSRVINRSPNVSAPTRAKVEQAIAELDYHPLNFARALVTRRSSTIGFVAGGVSYYGPISTIGALEARARDHGLAVSVAVFDERQRGRAQFESIISSFSGQGVDAFVYLTPTTELLRAALSVRTSRPSVFLTSASQQARRAALAADPARRRFVGIDQRAGEEQILALLTRLGRKSLLLLAGPQEWADASVRLEAIEEDAVSRGLHYQVVTTGSWKADAAERAVAEVYSGRRLADCPDTVVAANDVQALGALRALVRLGIRVPEEVSVTGFDDMPGADAVFPSLTTVRPDFQALGSLAMTQVLGMLSGDGDGDDDGDGDGDAGAGASAGTEAADPHDHVSSDRPDPEGPAIAGPAMPEERDVDGIRLLRPQIIVRESTAPVENRR